MIKSLSDIGAISVLADLMQALWSDIQLNPENYRDQNVSQILEEMKADVEKTAIDQFSNKWQVKEEELAYVVSNYNPTKERQSGENELKSTSDYSSYREKAEEPVSKLRYWKEVRSDFKELMEKEIMPLRR